MNRPGDGPGWAGHGTGWAGHGTGWAGHGTGWAGHGTGRARWGMNRAEARAGGLPQRLASLASPAPRPQPHSASAAPPGPLLSSGLAGPRRLVRLGTADGGQQAVEAATHAGPLLIDVGEAEADQVLRGIEGERVLLGADRERLARQVS